MHRSSTSAAVALAAPLLLGALGATASACPFGVQASRGPIVLADNAATSTPAPAGGEAKKPDTTAYPNSPNGSPATEQKGAPVVTDKAACAGATPGKCADTPAPSKAADTSDVKIATPTTIDGSAAPSK